MTEQVDQPSPHNDLCKLLPTCSAMPVTESLTAHEQQTDHSLWRQCWVSPLLVGAISAVLFLLTRTDAVQVADSGEVITAACNGGVPHPPGYPLYVLLGRGFCQLPWSTPAGRVGLLSLFSAIAAVLLLHGIVRLLTRNDWAARIAALTLATGSLFWRYASLAEVFALNVALCLAVIYCLLQSSQAPHHVRLRWTFFAALCLGLGLSNHHSSVLLVPWIVIMLCFPWPTTATWRKLVAQVVSSLFGLFLGLLPYLHLLLVDPKMRPRWGDTSTWSGMLHHVLRRDYGTFTLSHGGKAVPLENVGQYFSQLPIQLGWVLSPFLLVGLFVLGQHALRRSRGELAPLTLQRVNAIVLVLLPVLAGPLFLLLFNVHPQGIGAQVAERFYLLPNALCAILVGVGLYAAHFRLLGGEKNRRRRQYWQKIAYLILVLAGLTSYGKADVSQSYAVEDYARNALMSVERGALILGEGDVRLFSILYAQEMLHLRPDVQYLDVRMLLYPWYVQQKREARPALSYRFVPQNVDTIRLIQREMQRGVAVYLAVAYNLKVQAAFAGYPAGPLMRILPRDQSGPTLPQLRQLNQRLFRGFSHRGREPDPLVDPWSASLLESYARSWRAIALALYEQRDRKGSLEALIQGQHWAPWLPVPDWFGNTGPHGAITVQPRAMSAGSYASHWLSINVSGQTRGRSSRSLEEDRDLQQ